MQRGRAPGERRFLAVSAGLVVIYALASVALVASRDFDDTGPISFLEPARTEALPGSIPPRDALVRCFGPDARDGELSR